MEKPVKLISEHEYPVGGNSLTEREKMILSEFLPLLNVCKDDGYYYFNSGNIFIEFENFKDLKDFLETLYSENIERVSNILKTNNNLKQYFIYRSILIKRSWEKNLTFVPIDVKGLSDVICNCLKKCDNLDLETIVYLLNYKYFTHDDFEKIVPIIFHYVIKNIKEKGIGELAKVLFLNAKKGDVPINIKPYHLDDLYGVLDLESFKLCLYFYQNEIDFYNKLSLEVTIKRILRDGHYDKFIYIFQSGFFKRNGITIGDDLIYNAIEYGNLDCLKVLLSYREKPNSILYDMMIYYAKEYNKKEILEYLRGSWKTDIKKFGEKALKKIKSFKSFINK